MPIVHRPAEVEDVINFRAAAIDAEYEEEERLSAEGEVRDAAEIERLNAEIRALRQQG